MKNDTRFGMSKKWKNPVFLKCPSEVIGQIGGSHQALLTTNQTA